jgi:hypothetical protein
MARTQLRIEAGEREPETELPGTPGVQALTRGIQILDHVASSSRGLRFTELLERTGMPKGTLHRLLQALVEGGCSISMPATRPTGSPRACSNGPTRSGMSSICAAPPSPSWCGCAT